METIVPIAAGVALGILIAVAAIVAFHRYGPTIFVAICALFTIAFWKRAWPVAAGLLVAVSLGFGVYVWDENRRRQIADEEFASKVRTECALNRNGYLQRCRKLLAGWSRPVHASTEELLDTAYVMRTFYSHQGWSPDERQLSLCKRELERKTPACVDTASSGFNARPPTNARPVD